MKPYRVGTLVRGTGGYLWMIMEHTMQRTLSVGGIECCRIMRLKDSFARSVSKNLLRQDYKIVSEA
jgi:hypothetical protein